jgi:hypothetical protein
MRVKNIKLFDGPRHLVLWGMPCAAEIRVKINPTFSMFRALSFNAALGLLCAGEIRIKKFKPFKCPGLVSKRHWGCKEQVRFGLKISNLLSVLVTWICCGTGSARCR